MKTFSTTTPLPRTDALSLAVFHEKALFFDIETTGFSAEAHPVYLIGCASRRGDTVTLCQYFAETPAAEGAVLEAFCRLAAGFSTLISFHGSVFDLPFLEKRCRKLSLSFPLKKLQHTDLLRRIRPFGKILKLADLKQKSLEQFFGLHRTDPFSGGELTSVYQTYCRTPTEEALSQMKLHNYEDVLGMIHLLPLLSYEAFFGGAFSVQDLTRNTYQEYQAKAAQGAPVADANAAALDAPSQELILSLTPDAPFPQRISYGAGDLYLAGDRTNVCIRVKIFQGELKYFYPDYKNYYYLPQEDMAVHKSVGSYVDREFRTQARAATCYAKKSGRFLPQYSDRFSPCFRQDYRDKQSYLELSGDFLADQTFQKAYAHHLLAHLLNDA